jgi:transcription antitermination factor NusG
MLMTAEAESDLQTTMGFVNDAAVLPWYAVQVRAGGEPQVNAVLENKGYEVFCPTYLETRKYSDRLKSVNVALFSGYTFCRLEISKRLPVLVTEGVNGIVSFGGVPQPIPEEEIEKIRSAIKSGARAKPWPYLTAGRRIRIQCGSMAGLEGILVKIKGSDHVVLSITMLQRSVCVEIDRSWIQPVL